MLRIISAGVISITAAAAAGAYVWFKGKQNVETYPSGQDHERAAEPVVPEAASNRSYQPRAKSLLTPRHNWLLDVAVDSDVSAASIIKELGVTPRIGWHAEGTFVLAVFGARDDLLDRKDGIRLRINPDDYMRIQMAAAASQAVPIFTALDNNWIYRGFFVFNNPAAQTVRCRRETVSACD